MNARIIILNIALSILFYGCNSNTVYQEIQVNDVIKIESKFENSDNENIVYVWGAPISKSESVPEFEIRNDFYYFSAPEVGSYKIDLSIETKSGKEVVSEEFNYLAIDFIAKADKQYQPSTFPSKELRRKAETVEAYFTVQVCSKPDKKEAISESDKLFDFGFEDVYIEEYLHKDTIYWRVRTGIFNSKIKANKRKEEISKKLKIKPQDLWAVEVK